MLLLHAHAFVKYEYLPSVRHSTTQTSHRLNHRRWCHLASTLKHTVNKGTAEISTSGIAIVSMLHASSRQRRTIGCLSATAPCCLWLVGRQHGRARIRSSSVPASIESDNVSVMSGRNGYLRADADPVIRCRDARERRSVDG